MNRHPNRIKSLPFNKTMITLLKRRKELEQMIAESLRLPRSFLYGKSTSVDNR